MIALCTVPSRPLDALQACLSDAEHRAPQIKRLASAIICLIDDPQLRDCVVAWIERLTELTEDPTDAFGIIDRRLSAVIRNEATT
jgi:hypothetical protein